MGVNSSQEFEAVDLKLLGNVDAFNVFADLLFDLYATYSFL